jgi:serine/threonine protein kinase
MAGMETQKQAHPTAGELAAFALKRLKPDKQAQLQEHVSLCAQCNKFLQDNPPEKLAARLRQLAASRLSQQSTPGIGEGGTLASVPRAGAPLQPVVSKSPPAAAQPPGKPAVSGDRAKPLPVARSISPGAKGAGDAPQAVPRREDDIPADLRQQDRYEIVRKIGEGGMGSVFEGFHKLMKRRVAIKTINASISGHPDALKRFLREVEAAAKLSHANIAQAYDADKFGASHVLVSEFIDGASLDKVIDDGGSLPISQACEYVQQAARGLQHALDHGLAHRDIKPSNLMLTPAGTVKILDFGLAKFHGTDRESAGLTGMDRGMGTAQYMAPEQALDATNADIRADIYALGCTLYCLLTGAPPWEGDVVSVLTSHQRDIAQPLCERRPEVPKSLSDLVARMLAKNPADRPQTPLQIAELLEPFATCQSTIAEPEELPGDPGPKLGGISIVVTTPMKTIKKPSPPWESLRGVLQWWGSRKRPPWFWPVVGGGAAALLLVVVFAALGVLKVRTSDGTILIENVPADAKVLVDGSEVKLTRADDTVTIGAVGQGTHELRVEKNGVKVWAKTIDIAFAGERVTARFEANVADPQVEDPATPAPGPGEVIDGDWKVEGNELVQLSSAPRRPALIVFGDPLWSNYTLRCQVQFADADGDVKFFFHYAHFRKSRNFNFGNGSRLKSNHNTKWLGPERPDRFEPNRWHNVRIEVRSADCKCFVDERLLFDGRDDRFLSGRIGLGTRRTSARFRDIIVTDMQGKKLWQGLPILSAGGERSDGAAPLEDADLDPDDLPKIGNEALVPADPAARVARVFAGEWKVEGEELQQHSEAPPVTALSLGDVNWQDLDITLEAYVPAAPQTEVFVAFNCRDTLKYRFLRFGRNYQDFCRQNAFNDHTLIKRFNEPLEPGWHQVDIKTRGSCCECFVDGKLLISDDNAEYVGGCLGLGTFQTQGRFRKITIKSGGDTKLLWTGLPTVPAELTPLPGAAEDAAAPATPPKTAAADGFVPLFNGKDLTGWETHAAQPGDWQVKNGLLVGRSGLSYLYSKREDLQNVHVRVRARVSTGGNSGVFVRSTYGIKPGSNAPNGYEAAIEDGHGEVGTGGLYAIADDAQRVKSAGSSFKAGEFFTLEVIAQGTSIEVKVNGWKTAEYTTEHAQRGGGCLALQCQNANTVIEIESIEIKPLDATSDLKQGSHPADAKPFGGRFYKFFPESLNWHEARNRCAALGGRLAIVKSAAENEFLTELVRSQGAGRDAAWLGATDELREGVWQWTDGQEMHYTNWDVAGRQPNNKGQAEHYLILWLKNGGRWSDQPATSKAHNPGFICQWEK